MEFPKIYVVAGASEEPTVMVKRRAVTSSFLKEAASTPAQPRTTAAQRAKRTFRQIPGTLLRLLPCITWVANYDVKRQLVPDVLAGLSTGVLHVPQGMVSAIISGVGPVYGLYSSLYPALVYVLLGSSPYISMGMFAVTALMTANAVKTFGVQSNTTVGNESYPDFGDSPAGVAITVTMMSGLIQIALWLLRLDRLSVVISPIMAEGFLAGAAFTVVATQVPSVFDASYQSSKGVFGTVLSLYSLMANILSSNVVTTSMSLVAFVLLGVSKFVFGRRLKRVTAIPLPADLILVAAGATISYLLHLHESYEVSVVGVIPSGFPDPLTPSWRHSLSVLPDAAAIALVQFVSAVSMAELLGRKQRLNVDARQEMLAYGVSSVVGSFFQCIPTGSAVARSIILKDVGGQTQVSGLVSSAVVAVTLYAFAPLFEPLPKCILGVVIIVALVPMLLKVKNLPKLWKTSRSDAALWLLSCVSVIFLDVTYGLIVGSLLGLLIIFLKLNSHEGIYLQAYSSDIFLPSGSHISWHDGIVIFRFGSPLCFANHKNIICGFEEIFRETQPEKPQFIDETKNLKSAKAIVLDCSAISFIDSVGLAALNVVVETCHVNKCQLFLASLPTGTLSSVQSQPDLASRIGVGRMAPTIQDALALVKKELSDLETKHRLDILV
ncbi:sulfate transporter-like [Ixodes scapularis]|uniref:sulfate transporter-like n=1 Tax=Ixodes scapularis TaxID=6945 RepID=UPI001A9F0216|nr:sulfate transporter-like [Ixodes scapularis]